MENEEWTTERLMDLYRPDVHWLVGMRGVEGVHELVDALMREVTDVPKRELLRPRGISDDDMVAIHETWGNEAPTK